MRYDLKEILEIGEQGGFAVPAFNVYNLETVLGIMNAAEETGAPVIFQMYSRLFDSQVAQYVSPIILEAMNNMKTPVAFHLDQCCHQAKTKSSVSGHRPDVRSELLLRSVLC